MCVSEAALPVVVADGTDQRACDEGIPPHVWRIHGRDYDLMPFVADHPGGMMIMLGQGSDCTMLFETYHAFNEPRKRLRKHDVTPDGLNPPVPECSSVFLTDVRNMVREHFKDQPKWSHKATCVRKAILAALIVLEIAMACVWLLKRSVWAGFAAGALNYLIMVNLCHDGSHGALSGKAWVNTMGHFLGGTPWVTGQWSWWMQHVVSHHQHTNVVGKDVDASHFPFARWHRQVPHEICGGCLAGAHNMMWHAVTYAFATFSMSVIHPILFIFVPLGQLSCNGRLGAKYAGGVDTAPLPRAKLMIGDLHHDAAYAKFAGVFASSGLPYRSRALLAGNIAIFALSMTLLVVPIVTSPPGLWNYIGGVGLAFAPYVASSILFMGVTQVSHIQEACQSDATLSEPDPYKRQAMTSMDYCEASPIAAFLTGQLNLQSIHHTLPSISLVHYRTLYPKFHAICVAHGCTPQRATGACDVISKHLSYVYRLGRGDTFGDTFGAAPEHSTRTALATQEVMPALVASQAEP